MKYLILIIYAGLIQFPGFSQSGTLPRKLDDSTMLTSDSVSLHIKMAGKGTPCIFIHGGPGAWYRSFEQLGGSILEKKLTMYYFDQRGAGLSGGTQNDNYSPDRMVEDIENIRSLTGSDKVYVLAHSFGGILAYQYAAKYPEHIKGIILLNCTLNIPYSLKNQISFVNQVTDSHFTVTHNDSLMPVFMAARTALNNKGLGYRMLSDTKSHIAKLDSIDLSAKRNYTLGAQVLANPVYFTDFTSGTSNIHVPALVITGTRDHNIGPDHYKAFRFPDQTVKIINGGHLLYYEQNAEFAKAVFQFVK